MSDADESWQMLFYAGAVLLVLFKMWHGWRLGVVRQTAALLTIVAAYVAGFLGGRAAAPILRTWLPYPELVLSIIGGLIIAGSVFLVGTLLSAILFKKTAHQSVGVVRFGFGLLGAAVGALYGVVLVVIALIGIRLLGTVAEAQVTADANGPQRKETPPLLRGLAQLKRSLTDSPAAVAVEKVDPVSEEFYGTLEKVGTMAGDAKSVERFSEYPGVRPLLEHPKMLALLNDPEIARAATEHDYVALLSSRLLMQTAGDPELVELMHNLELQKALDYALRKTDNGPSRAAR
jgi:uncharacterized membrane protein required for colicin V production